MLVLDNGSRIRTLMQHGTPERSSWGWEDRMQRAVSSETVAAGWSDWIGRLREFLFALVRSAIPRRSGCLDIELRRENEKLRQECLQLRKLVEHTGRLSALGTLAAGIAHEIRNPLVSVRTFFQLAPQRWNDEQFATDFRLVTEKEVLRISDLVMELLSIARPPAHSREEVDIGEMLDRTVLLLGPQARRQRVELKRVVSEDYAYVRGVPDQLRQVLLNIVLNAIEATPPGGRVTVGATKIHDSSGPACRIEVLDTGSGIPADLQQSIFEPFITTKTDGTGLGLAIAHRIVAEHGGSISVHSSKGQMTRFEIDLPVGSSG